MLDAAVDNPRQELAQAEEWTAYCVVRCAVTKCCRQAVE